MCSLYISVTSGMMVERCRLVFLDTYNRTTNWQNSGNEPIVAGVVSSQNSLHIPARCLTAFVALFVMLSVAGPQAVRRLAVLLFSCG